MISDLELFGTDYYIKFTYKNLFASDYPERIVLRKAEINNLIPDLETIIGDIIQSNVFPIYISSRLFGISVGDEMTTVTIPDIDIFNKSVVYYLYQNKFSTSECFCNNTTFDDFRTYFYTINDYFELLSSGKLNYDNDFTSIETFMSAMNRLIFNSNETVFINKYMLNPTDFIDIQDKEIIDNAITENNEWNDDTPSRTRHRINMLIFQKIYDTYIMLPYYGFKDITPNILTGAPILYDTDITKNNIYIYQIATIPYNPESSSPMDPSDVFRSNVLAIRASDIIDIKPAHKISNSLYERYTNFDIVKNSLLNPLYINNTNYMFFLHRRFINEMIQSIKGIIDVYL
jgi:hypothetical protein